MSRILFSKILLLLILLTANSNTFASQKVLPHSDTIKIVIHLTRSYPASYQQAISYIKTIREEFSNNVDIKIVANGRGIAFVNSNNKFKPHVEQLLKEGVQISACNTTARIMRQYQKLPIVDGVDFVPTGVVEVIELQRKGYIYINP